MKKTYINPSLEVIKIASQAQMLAASENYNINGGFGNANGGSSGNGITSADGRGDDADWDD